MFPEYRRVGKSGNSLSDWVAAAFTDSTRGPWATITCRVRRKGSGCARTGSIHLFVGVGGISPVRMAFVRP